MTEDFKACLKKAARNQPLSATEVMFADHVGSLYPWFTTAALISCGYTRSYTTALALHIQAYGATRDGDEGIYGGGTEITQPETEEKSAGEVFNVLDNFFETENHHIIPDENISEDDISPESGILDISDNLVSEELASVYAAQGMNREAVEIYERLCLLNPEKSIYFASIIERINNPKPEKK